MRKSIIIAAIAALSACKTLQNGNSLQGNANASAKKTEVLEKRTPKKRSGSYSKIRAEQSTLQTVFFQTESCTCQYANNKLESISCDRMERLQAYQPFVLTGNTKRLSCDNHQKGIKAFIGEKSYYTAREIIFVDQERKLKVGYIY